VSDTLAGLLGRAVEAFERHDAEMALLRLLEAWREARIERIALLAERLTKLANQPPLFGGLLGVLCVFEAVLSLSKEVQDPTGILSTQLDDRVKEPADPRLTPVLLDLATWPAAHREEVFLPLCELFLRLKDPRTLAPLRALHASLSHRSPYGRRLGLTLERLDVGPAPTPRADEAALCDALEEALARREEALARSAPLRQALFGRIHAAPDDEGARLVLADHLLEQGDPLGELIMLQCQPQPDEAQVARLLEKHGVRWEAVLLGMNTERRRTRFERGLPVAVRMESGEWVTSLAPPRPSWRTVREIDWNWRRPDGQAEWLTHPHLRNVTVLRNMQCTAAAKLGLYPLPVRRLVTSGGVAAVAPELFNTLASLAHLSWLELVEGEPEDVRLCAASGLAQRLERFEVSRMGAWSLGVAPAAEVPVEATLVSEERCEAFAEVLRAAAGFSTRALRVQSQRQLDEGRRRALEEAASGYARVEWNLPPS
jgi:uncharacterized protein (TIGR02996 family)